MDISKGIIGTVVLLLGAMLNMGKNLDDNISPVDNNPKLEMKLPVVDDKPVRSDNAYDYRLDQRVTALEADVAELKKARSSNGGSSGGLAKSAAVQSSAPSGGSSGNSGKPAVIYQQPVVTYYEATYAAPVPQTQPVYQVPATNCRYVNGQWVCDAPQRRGLFNRR